MSMTTIPTQQQQPPPPQVTVSYHNDNIWLSSSSFPSMSTKKGDGDREGGIAEPEFLNHEKILVLYSFATVDYLNLFNLTFFIQHGCFQHSNVQFVFITDPSHLKPYHYSILPAYVELYSKTMTSGYDANAYSEYIVSHLDSCKTMDYIFFINDSVIGPCMSSSQYHWMVPFLHKLQLQPSPSDISEMGGMEIGLVGCSINYHQQKHIQSYAFVITQDAFQCLLQHDLFHLRYGQMEKEEIIHQYEWKLTQILEQEGFRVTIFSNNITEMSDRCSIYHIGDITLYNTYLSDTPSLICPNIYDCMFVKTKYNLTNPQLQYFLANRPFHTKPLVFIVLHELSNTGSIRVILQLITCLQTQYRFIVLVHANNIDTSYYETIKIHYHPLVLYTSLQEVKSLICNYVTMEYVFRYSNTDPIWCICPQCAVCKRGVDEENKNGYKKEQHFVFTPYNYIIKNSICQILFNTTVTLPLISELQSIGLPMKCLLHENFVLNSNLQETFKLLQKIGFVSMATMKCITEQQYLEKTSVIHNAVSMDSVSSSIPPVPSIPMLELQPDALQHKMVLMMIGTVEHRKRQLPFIQDIYLPLKQIFENLVLVIIGNITGEVEKEVVNWNGKQDIYFLGKQLNASSFIPHCDIYISYSMSESFPLNIVEAMLLKKPIVAVNVFGIAEQLDNGINGYAVPLDDISTFRNCIQTLILSPQLRLQFGEMASQKAQQTFTMEKFQYNYEFFLSKYEYKLGIPSTSFSIAQKIKNLITFCRITPFIYIEDLELQQLCYPHYWKQVYEPVRFGAISKLLLLKTDEIVEHREMATCTTSEYNAIFSMFQIGGVDNNNNCPYIPHSLDGLCRQLPTKLRKNVLKVVHHVLQHIICSELMIPVTTKEMGIIGTRSFISKQLNLINSKNLNTVIGYSDNKEMEVRASFTTLWSLSQCNCLMYEKEQGITDDIELIWWFSHCKIDLKPI